MGVIKPLFFGDHHFSLPKNMESKGPQNMGCQQCGKFGASAHVTSLCRYSKQQ
jgi:hypothetical protein